MWIWRRLVPLLLLLGICFSYIRGSYVFVFASVFSLSFLPILGSFLCKKVVCFGLAGGKRRNRVGMGHLGVSGSGGKLRATLLPSGASLLKLAIAGALVCFPDLNPCAEHSVVCVWSVGEA